MILTDDEIKKAAEFAAAQMWPESGYVGWTEDDAEFFRKFTDALIDKLLKGVELPEPFDDWPEYNEFAEGCGLEDRCITDRYEAMRHGWQACEDRTHEQGPYFTRDQLLAYGAAQRLAGQQWKTIESAPKGANNYSFMRLAWGPEEDKVTGQGMHANGKFYAVAIFYEMGQERKYVFREIEVEPTHWQPLPHPPASPQEQT